MSYKPLKWIPLFVLIVLWSACSSDKDYEVISAEDFFPQAKGNYDYPEDTITDEKAQLTEIEKKLKRVFPEINFEKDNPLKKRKKLFMPDRLGSKKKEESYFYKDELAYHLKKWTFEDNSQTINAFYNWLDCFNHDCRSIRIDEETNASNEAFIIWVSNNQITYLACSNSIDLRTWQKALFEGTNHTWSYVIQQAPNSMVKWIVTQNIVN
ncbi:MAG TPA: hypothetical protein VKX29_05540 [Brumimicrobium sp.]|nr:hypothetical protein [Brumimicrobium sp.]